MTTKEKIFIVEGATGEYSDRKEWAVCAFEQEEKAKNLVEKLSGMARVVELQDDKYDMETTDAKAILALDPMFSMDYTGTTYTAYEVEVRK